MKHLKNQKGAVLVIAIIMLAVVSILGVAMIYSVANEVRMNKAIEERTIAKYLAQSGIDHALYLVENDDGTMVYPYDEEVMLENGTRVYEMSIIKDGATIIISSTGKIVEGGFEKQQVSLLATIDETGKVIIE